MDEHSPMPWKYLEQTGFVVDANGVYIAQTWNKNEENFPNAVANGNAITQLTAENAKLRAELAEAVAALRTLNAEMSAVAYSGFDPERWGERIGALDAAGRVLAKHAAT